MGRRNAIDWLLDAGIWLVFFALLVPAVVLGYAIGHSSKSTGATKTIRITATTTVMTTTTTAAAAPGKGSGTTTTAAGDPVAGRSVFGNNCAVCHGPTGHGGNGGPDIGQIPSAKQLSVVLHQVRYGGGGMPPFRSALSAKDVADVAAYVTQQVAGSG